MSWSSPGGLTHRLTGTEGYPGGPKPVTVRISPPGQLQRSQEDAVPSVGGAVSGVQLLAGEELPAGRRAGDDTVSAQTLEGSDDVAFAAAETVA